MSDPDTPMDDKYSVFNTVDLHMLLEQWGLEMHHSMQLDRTRLRDAVVIRRQDYFASPCLATYAAMIALVASREADPKMKTNLLDIADYFERQAQLAAEEGWKLPDL